MYYLKLIILSLILNIFLPLAANAEEKISRYYVTLTLNNDSSLDISESISVNSEGVKIRRGIFRDFPTEYKSSSGIPTVIDLNILKVLKESAPEQFHTERLSNGTRIYIGKKESFLPYGKHTYQLDFTTIGQVGFFADHDELYFNAIGHGWDFQIDEFEVIVKLPEKISQESIKVDGFTGSFGSVDKSFTSERGLNNSIRFESTNTLAPGEGFTFVISFEKGVISPPTLTMHLKAFLKRYYNAIIGIFVSFAGFLILFFGWFFRGIDPKKGIIFPRFSPPPDFSPAAVIFLQNMGYSSKCLSSLIVSIATKGAIKIVESGTDSIFIKDQLKLIKVDGFQDKLTEEESRIVELIFGSEQEIEIDQKNHITFMSAKSYLSSTLKTKLQRYYNLNSGIFAIGCILQFFATYLVFSSGLELIGGIFLVGSVLNVGIFWYLIRTYSKKGREILDEVEGFKMYLETAEKDTYSNLTYPEISQQIFEKFLPYAVALGAEASWMKGFKNALEKAGKDFNQYRPPYYVGDMDNFNANTFSNFSSNLTKTISSASSPPSKSSGSSGGGFSGGGGGGGGGGGW